MRLAALALLSSASVAAGAPSTACAECHRAIFESYRRTPMAASGGVAGSAAPLESMDHAAFVHAASGFRYRVRRSGARYSLEFENIRDAALRGHKELAYFVGSGATARSYLLSSNGFLYEAPVAYYAAAAKWDFAPGYDRYAYPYLTRPVPPACLTCHASFLDPVQGTQNRFASPPFREGGVACERCHGPGDRHIAQMKSGSLAGGTGIVNPAKLPPDRRDSICAQCHLSGEVRVMRPGATWQSYRPGGRLSDAMTVFVPEGATPGMRVTSHFEKLEQSACKRGSGDRLWCGTCHDPHVLPSPAERAAWFRSRCLGCHREDACTSTRSARAALHDDCVGCHMPKNRVADAQHVVYTDHSIPRLPRAAAPVTPLDAKLVPFRGMQGTARDLALAYAIRSARQGTPAREALAMRLLEEVESRSPDDAEVLLYLAEIYRNRNMEERAIPLYRRAMELDPTQVTAPVGLGGILFERGQDAQSIRLWENALSRNSGLVLTATNLAMAYWRSGDFRSAETLLRTIIELSPGFAPPRQLLDRFERIRIVRPAAPHDAPGAPQ